MEGYIKSSCSSCMATRTLLEHSNKNKKLEEFTKEELIHFPLKYLLESYTSHEILLSWSKLPSEYREDFALQTKLPCFIHHNRPEWETHVDGPAPSQSKCYICQLGLQK